MSTCEGCTREGHGAGECASAGLPTRRAGAGPCALLDRVPREDDRGRGMRTPGQFTGYARFISTTLGTMAVSR